MNGKIREILDVFTQINTIPRCSGQEAAISGWLLSWAVENGFDASADTAGNLVVRVPPSVGYERSPVIALQGHMDMVCEKTPDSEHDFSTDPIQTIRDGDWVRADRTTLGADNGIALAIAMVLAADRTIAHPPLELLFTVDEETGLNGAKKIETGLFRSKILLNIDSEKEGTFTIGCAGGRDTRIDVPLLTRPVSETDRPLKISVSGLCGGHSGVDIHKNRANANLLLARCLDKLREKGEIRLAEVHGGSAHNAIPRDAAAVVVCGRTGEETVSATVSAFEKTARREFEATEPDLKIAVEVTNTVPSALSVRDTNRIVYLLVALPHGVMGMSSDVAGGVVETSTNLATIRTLDGQMQILTSQRSSMQSKLDEVSSKIRALAALAGGTTKNENEYPPWPPDRDAPLLERCRREYRDLFAKDPVVEVMHAGLECAIIGSKFEGMQMISFGPDLENPHSPGERLNIPSVGKIWRFLLALLKSYRT